ncbi:hypothetical protein MJO29_006665 [Puccinia striiformis f. sp. tritici]|nr:hypothetical protein MJO29_006665 [Puccinia striiformis f. sp. tritici]
MHFNSVLFLSLMATLGNVAAVDWDCDLGRHEKYCGAKVQSSGTSTCYLFPRDGAQVNGECYSFYPDHKCCNKSALEFVSRSQVPTLHFRRSDLGADWF